MWLGLRAADWVVLAACLAVFVVLGVRACRRATDVTDFFMAGRRCGKVLLTSFSFSTGTSHRKAMFVVARTFQAGLSSIWLEFLQFILTPVLWILAPVLRRLRALTLSDFFERRFSPAAAVAYVLFGVFLCILNISGALFATGKLAESLTGGQLPFAYAVAVMVIIALAYGLAGGLRAVIVADLIQGIVTIALSVLLLLFLMQRIGGWAALHAPSDLLAVHRPGMMSMAFTSSIASSLGRPPLTGFYVTTLLIVLILSGIVQPSMANLCGAGRTEFDVQVGTACGGILKRVCSIIWVFTGLACIVLYLTPQRAAQFLADPSHEGRNAFADQVFGLAVRDTLSVVTPGLLGLFVASVFMAAMTACDVEMIIGSGLFTDAFYKRFIRPGQSPRHYVFIGRLAAAALVGIGWLLTFRFTSALSVIEILVGVPAAVGLAFCLGLIWRRYTTAAVFASCIAAYGVWVFLEWQPGARLIQHFFPSLVTVIKGKLEVDDAWIMGSYLSVAAVVGIVTSLLTRPVPKAKLDAFYRLIRTPVGEHETIAESCVLPAGALPPREGKLIDHPDIEIPKPTPIAVGGFLVIALIGGLLVWLTRWLAQPG